MSDTTPPPATGPAPSRTARRGAGPLKKVVLALASLRLTVFLFVLSLVIVFCGTLAQRDTGIQTVVNQYFRSFFVWIPLKNLLFVNVPGAFPYPGGWLIGSALMVNLLAAHAVRFRLTWRRSGVLVLHFGLLLMMVGEFVTGEFAIEGNMTIPADSSSNFLVHPTAFELAVVDPSGAKTDDVVVIPSRLLRPGETIRHPDLPFDVQVDRWMVNSKVALAPGLEKRDDARALMSAVDSSGLVEAPPGIDNPATAGLGKQFIAVPRPEGAGADPEQRIDFPAVYVTLRPKDGGEPLGTYLFSSLMLEQPVRAGGKTYDVSLRMKRTFKPYTVHLIEFRHDLYEGTNIPKNFSSQIRLDDPTEGVSREALIYMNNPLRYKGETFYQSSFLPGDTGTVLQVVRNPGWQLPYWSCALVALGMLLHFGLTLTDFLSERFGFERRRFGVAIAWAGPGVLMILFATWLLLGARLDSLILSFLLTVCALIAVFKKKFRGKAPHPDAPTPPSPPPAEPPILETVPAPRTGTGITTAAARPVTAGRITTGKKRKPAPVVAAQGGAGFQPASQRQVENLPHVAAAADDTTFARIFPWTVLALGLLYFAVAMAPPADPAGNMHLEEFAGLPVLHNGRIKPIDTVARTSLMTVSDRQTYRDDKGHPQPAIKWLLDVMTSYFFETRAGAHAEVIRIENDQVLNFLGLKARPGLRYSLAEVAPHLKKIEEEAERAQSMDESHRDLFAVKIIDLARKLHLVFRLTEMSEPRTIPPAVEGAEWTTLPGAVRAMHDSGGHDKAVLTYHQLLSAYAKNNSKAFNEALAEYRSLVDARMPKAADKAGLELFFNNFEPFYQCAVMYVLVFLLGCLSWMGWSRPLGRAAFWLAILTLVVHTWALGARMVIMGRPPVTNLYSSAIFIGWAGAVLCLAMEPIFRNGICTVVAAAGGALTMLIAHLLANSSGGDTMEMLQAVLDTNFWLATHVTCVTIGYATTFVAGLLGMGFILYNGLSWLKPSLDRSVFKTLGQMTYGVVCFATFFSFVGTVLGGIWADQSWGRFWGWDPKENGALLIVIWNALILHARWAGMVKLRGLAVLAVLGNIVTSWSWFGTNMLGVGLHSYGFMAGAFWGLLGACLFFLTWAVGGLFLPKR